MPRKVFDVNCKEDVLELFRIINAVCDDAAKIQMRDNYRVIAFLDSEDCYITSMSYSRLSFGIRFHNQTEITRPVNEEEWIGKLCWFWDDTHNKMLDFLDRIENKLKRKYISNNYELGFINCRPLTLSEWEQYKPKQ